MSKLSVLDLFSGIGGFSLGLERTGGFETVAFCEIEPFCRRVLAKHWPSVPCYEDVKTLTAERLRDDGISVDLICGGFPCQDISAAGKGAGIDGKRSGLWSEFARLIGEIRPRFVIVENVAMLLHRGLGRVLGDLAALGFDAEWHCISASAVGAPHIRDRVWIIAYPQHPDADLIGSHRAAEHDRSHEPRDEQGRVFGQIRKVLADTDEPRLERWLRRDLRECAGERAVGSSGSSMADAWGIAAERYRPSLRSASQRDWWLAEPDVGRVAHGIPARVDRLRALGNAVVPQIPEMIGRAILTAEARS